MTENPHPHSYPDCRAVSEVLSRVGDKWTVLLVKTLEPGPRRFNDLRREIGGISQQMLTRTLRTLERDGMVARKVHPTVPPSVEYALTQALLAAPMFGARWRWNATRALAILRMRGGRKVPPQLMRMRADDLLASCFPDQAACAENLTGPIRIPDHVLVRETIDNCLHEAMDLDGLMEVLRGVESGAIRTAAVDTPEPSPFCHEILNANPYAYLDDAPL